MASIEKNKNYLMAERQLSPSRRGLLGLSAAIGVSSLLPGCALPGRGQAVPRNLTHQASVLGIKNERFLIPNDLPALVEEFQLAAERRAARRSGGDPMMGPCLRCPAVGKMAHLVPAFFVAGQIGERGQHSNW